MNLSKNIFFTIIIPCYNSEETIQRCIKSVLIQNFKRIEILVINDCSKDGTLNILKKYKKKIAIINNKKNFGVGHSRNKGIDKANGKYLIFLDADDILIKNKLKNLYNEINKYKKIDFLIGQHNINRDGYLYKNNINNKTISNKLKFINNLDKFYGYCWRFIIYSAFEIGGAPVFKLYRSFTPKCIKRSIYIFWVYITSKHEITCYVFVFT